MLGEVYELVENNVKYHSISESAGVDLPSCLLYPEAIEPKPIKKRDWLKVAE